MPKDNEVDEKVEDFFDRLYGMTFRLFLDQNSEEDEGNTVELRLAATVDNLALFEMQDHAVLYSAATVAELRAEVERLRVIEAAARTYYMNYCQDEVFDKLDDYGRGLWTGASAKQIHDASALRDALTGADPT